MPYTNHDLLTAIQQDDLRTVQKIIVEYQARSSDSTELFAGGTSIHGNALLFALAHARTIHSNSLAIVNALLAVRDHQSRPVLNLNAMSHDPSQNSLEHRTVLFYVLQKFVEPSLRVQLLSALLNAKGSSGPLSLQLSAGMVSPLNQSVYLEDVACFNLLCRVQNPDGSAFFKLNRLLQPSNKTLLEIASQVGSNQAIVQAIRLAGGKTRNDLQMQQTTWKNTFKSAAIVPFDMVPMAIMNKEMLAVSPAATTPAVVAPCQATPVVASVMQPASILKEMDYRMGVCANLTPTPL